MFLKSHYCSFHNNDAWIGGKKAEDQVIALAPGLWACTPFASLSCLWD